MLTLVSLFLCQCIKDLVSQRCHMFWNQTGGSLPHALPGKAGESILTANAELDNSPPGNLGEITCIVLIFHKSCIKVYFTLKPNYYLI